MGGGMIREAATNWRGWPRPLVVFVASWRSAPHPPHEVRFGIFITAKLVALRSEAGVQIEKGDHGASANPVLAFGTDLPTDMEIDSDIDIDPIMDMDIDRGSAASAVTDMITCPDFANDPFFNKAEVSWLPYKLYLPGAKPRGPRSTDS